MAAESQCPRRLGEKFRRAVDVVGGTLPLPPTEFAERAYRHALNPLHNPIREVMLGYGGDVRKACSCSSEAALPHSRAGQSASALRAMGRKRPQVLECVHTR